MRFFTQVLVLVGLLLVNPISASTRDLSNYRCDVFNAAFCFRLPAGAEVRHSVPSDFHFYEVLVGPTVIATVYAGDGIRAPEPNNKVKLIPTTAGALSVSHGSEAGIDIYIRPSGQEDLIVHLSVTTDPGMVEVVRELTSSLRPCRAIRAGGQRCPVNTAWSKEILAFLPSPSPNDRVGAPLKP